MTEEPRDSLIKETRASKPSLDHQESPVWFVPNAEAVVSRRVQTAHLWGPWEGVQKFQLLAVL